MIKSKPNTLQDTAQVVEEEMTLRELQRLLKKHYQTQATITRISDGKVVPIEGHYVQLEWVKVQSYHEDRDQAAEDGEATEKAAAVGQAQGDVSISNVTVSGNVNFIIAESRQSISNKASNQTVNRATTSNVASSSSKPDVERHLKHAVSPVKKPASLEDIFNQSSDKSETSHPHAVIYGSAGMGKTTFCLEALLGWSQGVWGQQFSLVFLIPFRALLRYRQGEGGWHAFSWMEVIEAVCLKPLGLNEPAMGRAKRCIEGIVHQAPHRVLMVLDGLDEVVTLLSGAGESALDIFLKRLMQSHPFLLTTRPNYFQLGYLPLDNTLQLMGFSEEARAKYIREYFATDISKAEALLGLIRQRAELATISQVPLQADLLCGLCEGQDEALTRLATLTMSELYEGLVEKLLHRYLIKYDYVTAMEELTSSDVAAWCQPLLAFCERIAYEGLRANQVVITNAMIQAQASDEHVFPCTLKLGVIQGLEGHLAEGARSATFSHLSFQEYFAARYAVRALNEPHKSPYYAVVKFLWEEKYEARYRLMLRFMGGLLHQSSLSQPQADRAFQTFWKALLESPQAIGGTSRIHLLFDVLEACQLDERIPGKASLLREVRDWVDNGLQGLDRHKTPAIDLNLVILFRTHPWVAEACYDVVMTHVKENSSVAMNLLPFSSRGHVSEVYAYLDRCVRDKDESDIRRAAIRVIEDFVKRGDIDKRLWIWCAIGVNDKEEIVRSTAMDVVKAFVERGDVDERLWTWVTTGINDWFRGVRWVVMTVVKAFVERGDVDERLWTWVALGINDEDRYVRWGAMAVVKAFVKRDESDEQLRTWVTTGINDEDMFVRRVALEVVEVLVKRDEKDWRLRTWVTTSVNDEDKKVRCATMKLVKALVQCGKQDEQLRTWVTTGVNDEDKKVRCAAMEVVAALVQRGESDDQLRTWVTTGVNDEDKKIRCAALEVVKVFVEHGKQDKQLWTWVTTGVNDEDRRVRNAAMCVVKAFVERGTSDERLRMWGAISINDKDGNVRHTAMEVVAAFVKRGEWDQRLWTWVTTGVNDKEIQVRRAAMKVVKIFIECECSESDDRLWTWITTGVNDKETQVCRAAKKALKTLLLRRPLSWLQRLTSFEFSSGELARLVTPAHLHHFLTLYAATDVPEEQMTEMLAKIAVNIVQVPVTLTSQGLVMHNATVPNTPIPLSDIHRAAFLKACVERMHTPGQPVYPADETAYLNAAQCSIYSWAAEQAQCELASSAMNEVLPPKPNPDYCCLITKQLFYDPVMAADGKTYEREAIEGWFKKSQSSPWTGEPFGHLDLRSQPKLKGASGCLSES